MIYHNNPLNSFIETFVYADSLVNWILYVKNNCNSLPVFIALTIS